MKNIYKKEINKNIFQSAIFDVQRMDRLIIFIHKQWLKLYGWLLH